MRYAREHKSNTHKKIVTAASELFRSQGIGNVGVNDLMQRAGLTHGGFYAHFNSKEALAAEACRVAFEESGQRMRALIEQTEPGRKFAAAVERYLSPLHRDNSTKGCMAAALAGEAARHPGAVRDAMTAGIKRLVEAAERMIEQDGLQIDAYSAVATMVGAVILSRAVSDPKCSEQLLTHARETLLAATAAPKRAARAKAKTSTSKAAGKRARSE